MNTCVIDWTDNEVHLYSFERKRGRFILSDTRSFPVEGTLNRDTLSSDIPTHFDNVLLSIPVKELSLREVSFPFHDKDKIKETISYELEGVLLGRTEEYSIDHLITETAGNESRVLAVCIEKKRLRDIIDTLSSVGLEPKVITSIDIRLSEGLSGILPGSEGTAKGDRAEAAQEELAAPTVNLRQDELSYVRDIERGTKTLQLSLLLLLVFILIIGTNTILRFISLKEEHTILKKEIDTVYHKAFPEDLKILDPVRQFRGNLNRLVENKSVLAGIPALDILRDIAELKKNGTTLYEFNSGEKNILIKGITSSFEEVESFKNRLSTSFDDVSVTDSNASSDKEISFSIVMKRKRI